MGPFSCPRCFLSPAYFLPLSQAALCATLMACHSCWALDVFELNSSVLLPAAAQLDLAGWQPADLQAVCFALLLFLSVSFSFTKSSSQKQSDTEPSALPGLSQISCQASSCHLGQLCMEKCLRGSLSCYRCQEYRGPACTVSPRGPLLLFSVAPKWMSLAPECVLVQGWSQSPHLGRSMPSASHRS